MLFIFPSLPSADLFSAQTTKWLKQGTLWVLDIDYVSSNLVAVGVNKKLDFSDPEKLKAVEIFRDILNPDRTDIQLYLHLTSEVFSNASNLLLHKFKKEILTHPFSEYRSKITGNYVIQWNNEQYQPYVDTYTRRVKKTFRRINHYSLTHAYGVMRDVSQSLQYGQDALGTQMRACFIALPGCVLIDGKPSQYLAFVQCDNQEHLREFYNEGDVGQMIFELPDDKDFEPVGWRFIVRPAVPNCEAPGNLTLQVRRRKGDDFEVPTESHPHPAMMSMDVYLWPTVSDVSPRRLVNAANLIRQPNPEIKELQRFVQALDLSEDCDYVSPFAKHQAFNDKETEAILEPLSVSQRAAFFHIVNSKHRIVLIQGPPGE